MVWSPTQMEAGWAQWDYANLSEGRCAVAAGHLPLWMVCALPDTLKQDIFAARVWRKCFPTPTVLRWKSFCIYLLHISTQLTYNGMVTVNVFHIVSFLCNFDVSLYSKLNYERAYSVRSFSLWCSRVQDLLCFRSLCWRKYVIRQRIAQTTRVTCKLLFSFGKNSVNFSCRLWLSSYNDNIATHD